MESMLERFVESPPAEEYWLSRDVRRENKPVTPSISLLPLCVRPPLRQALVNLHRSFLSHSTFATLQNLTLYLQSLLTLLFRSHPLPHPHSCQFFLFACEALARIIAIQRYISTYNNVVPTYFVHSVCGIIGTSVSPLEAARALVYMSTAQNRLFEYITHSNVHILLASPHVKRLGLHLDVESVLRLLTDVCSYKENSNSVSST